jgi:hypothetical protein
VRALHARRRQTLFGGAVEQVPDAIEQGLITASAIPAGTDVCYYRPTPDDGSRFAAVGVIPPGALSDEEYRAQVEGGVALGGPGDDGFEVNGSVVTRVDDTVILALATTEAGAGNDPSAGLEIATLIVSRLPPPTPDPANLACQLLTEELARSAVGIDLGFDGDEANGQRSGCQYSGRTGPGYVILRVTQGSDAAADFEAERARFEQDVAFREVSGLGDSAFVTDLDVFVLDGPTFLWISAYGEDGPAIDGGLDLAEALVALD